MYRETIGIVGGFGAYATLNFYKRLLQEFSSENERNYPHIIIDNNFTMPSRTRALLYEEAYEQVVKEISASIRMLMDNNASKIILVCGTAHYFLQDIYRQIPEAQEKIVNIIDIVGEELQKQKKDTVLVIAAEGALKKNIYVNGLSRHGINVVQPTEDEYLEIRYFIESVKQNMLSNETVERFNHFLGGGAKGKLNDVVLGCTEFPVIVQFMEDLLGPSKYNFYDPLEMTIKRLKQILT